MTSQQIRDEQKRQLFGGTPHIELIETYAPDGETAYVVQDAYAHLGPEPSTDRIDEVDRANGQLLGAAAGLMAAVNRFLESHQAAMDANASGPAGQLCRCGACEEGRAAIAKARGE